MVVTLPLRTPTVIRSGVRGTRIVRERVRRNGKRRTVRRRVETIEPESKVAFGREAQIVGRLQTSDGRPLPNAEVQVLSRSTLVPERLEAVIRTDAEGNYAYTAGPGSTRTFRVRLSRNTRNAAGNERSDGSGAGSVVDPTPTTASAKWPGSAFHRPAAFAPSAGGRKAGGVAGDPVRPLADIPHYAYLCRWIMESALPIPPQLRPDPLSIPCAPPCRDGISVRSWGDQSGQGVRPGSSVPMILRCALPSA